MNFCFLFSVVWSLQLGFKANERNVAKPVIVCKSEEQRDAVQVRSHVSRWDLFWSGKRLGGCLDFVGRGRNSGNCFCCSKLKSIILDFLSDTTHFSQVAFVALQLPSKVAWEGMISYPCCQLKAPQHPDTQVCRDSSPELFATHSVKATGV